MVDIVVRIVAELLSILSRKHVRQGRLSEHVITLSIGYHR